MRLGAAATSLAQQPAVPVLGFLYFGATETSSPWVAAFRKGLSESGFSEGHNVTIEYRWAHNGPERLPELAVDLVRRRVAVIQPRHVGSDACCQSRDMNCCRAPRASPRCTTLTRT